MGAGQVRRMATYLPHRLSVLARRQPGAASPNRRAVAMAVGGRRLPSVAAPATLTPGRSPNFDPLLILEGVEGGGLG